MTDRSDTQKQHKAEMIAAARLQIARRVARFCTSLTSVEFECLLDRMVQIHWKYDVLPHLDPTNHDGEPVAPPKGSSQINNLA